MIYIKDEAIVLKSQPVLDSDLSITVYLKKLGKENIFIKGGQRIKHPYLPVLQRSNWIRGVFLQYKDKLLIKEVDKSYNFAATYSKDLNLFYTWNWIVDIFDRYTTFPDEKMFNLLKKTLYHLKATSDVEIYKLRFLLRYIYLQGLFPQIGRCVKCGTPITKENFGSFSFKDGGTICKACSRKKGSDLEYRDLRFVLDVLKGKGKKGENVSPKLLTEVFKNYLQTSLR